MKRGFTLIEMLIVVVVLVTLMAMTFRLSGLGEDQWKRNTTISHLQRIENCLSGYYAAFNSYPAVKLHGTRNIYLETGPMGLQKYGDNESENENIWNWDPEKFRRYAETWDGNFYQKEEDAAWSQVRAACMAQPVACCFPFPDVMANSVNKISETMKKKANSNESRYKRFREKAEKFGSGFVSVSEPNVLNNLKDEEDWREVQLFKFGLMSFLLPRYLFMLDVDDNTANIAVRKRQWSGNNAPVHDPWTGDVMTWNDVHRYSQSDTKRDITRISGIYSQSVCARWLPNLKGICACNYKTVFYGIDIYSGWGNSLDTDNDNMEVYSTGKDGSGAKYVLDSITVKDGWGHELFYYSPSPHQTYVLWSAGPNGRTFPPWIDRAGMDQKENRCIGAWIEDDIVNMRN